MSLVIGVTTDDTFVSISIHQLPRPAPPVTGLVRAPQSVSSLKRRQEPLAD